MQSSIKLIIMAATILAAGGITSAQTSNKKALLVIDIQENLLDSGSKLHVDPATIPSFIENVNKAIKVFEKNDMPIIYTVNESSNPVFNMLTGNVCKKGAKGTGIDKRIRLVNDNVYIKSRMSALTNKKLSRFLKENSISELYIAGLFAEACIKGTVRGSIRNDYRVTIIEDAVGSKSISKKTRSVNFYKTKGSAIITADQLEKLNTINGSARSN